MRKHPSKLLIVAWLLFLAILSLQPARPSAAHVAGYHRLFHFLAFGLTALLLRARPARRYPSLTAAFATIAFGAALEIAQAVLYHNVLEWWDIRDDSIGAVVAVASYKIIQWRYANQVEKSG